MSSLRAWLEEAPGFYAHMEMGNKRGAGISTALLYCARAALAGRPLVGGNLVWVGFALEKHLRHPAAELPPAG